MGKVAAIKLIDFYIVTFALFIVGTTILGVLSSLFDPRCYNVIPFIGLFLPVLLAIDLITCIYLILTKRLILSCITAMVLILGSIGAGYKLTNLFNSKTNPIGGNIRVMTFNIGGDKIGGKDQDKLKEIARFIKTEGIDILCIQEYPSHERVADSLKEYLNFLPFQTFTEKESNYLKIAIFSRFPIQNIKRILFNNSVNNAIFTDLMIDNRTIRLVSAHMQTTNLKENQIYSGWKQPNTICRAISNLNSNLKMRASQANLIKEEINSSEFPVIFCGDMNDPPTSYTYKVIKSGLKDGFEECGKGIGHTFHGFFNLLRIDYILYSNDLTGVKYDSPNKSFSDHNPVIMDLMLQ